jgi:hypothetical protein
MAPPLPQHRNGRATEVHPAVANADACVIHIRWLAAIGIREHRHGRKALRNRRPHGSPDDVGAWVSNGRDAHSDAAMADDDGIG